MKRQQIFESGHEANVLMFIGLLFLGILKVSISLSLNALFITHILLTPTPSLSVLPLSALISVTGASVYVAYSAEAFRQLMQLMQGMLEPKSLEGLRILFGWSLALAWVSCASELLTSIAFLLACRVITQKREQRNL